MPTTIQSTRKNVPKPSTTIMPPKAGPGSLYAMTEAPRAASNARIVMCPKTLEERLCRMGSNTIRKVPKMISRISGRKRRASCALKKALTSTRHLHGTGFGGGLYAVTDVHVGLFQNGCRV